MKLAFGFVLTLAFVALNYQCDASTVEDCCANPKVDPHFYVKIKKHHLPGKVLHTKQIVNLQNAHRDDGFDYFKYLALSTHNLEKINPHHNPFFQRHPIRLHDVCFHATCIGGFKVVVFDAHMDKIATFKGHVDFADDQQYYDKGLFCLSHAQYQTYYSFPLCVPRVSFIRVYVMPKIFTAKDSAYIYTDTSYSSGKKLQDYIHPEPVGVDQCVSDIHDGYATGCSVFVKKPYRYPIQKKKL